MARIGIVEVKVNPEISRADFKRRVDNALRNLILKNIPVSFDAKQSSVRKAIKVMQSKSGFKNLSVKIPLSFSVTSRSMSSLREAAIGANKSGRVTTTVPIVFKGTAKQLKDEIVSVRNRSLVAGLQHTIPIVFKGSAAQLLKSVKDIKNSTSFKDFKVRIKTELAFSQLQYEAFKKRVETISAASPVRATVIPRKLSKVDVINALSPLRSGVDVPVRVSRSRTLGLFRGLGADAGRVFGQSMGNNIFQGLTVGFSITALLGLFEGARIGGSLADSIRELEVVTNKSRGSLQGILDLAIEIGDNPIFPTVNPADAVDAAKALAKSNVELKDIRDSLESVVGLAEVSGITFDRAGQQVGGLINSFGLAGSEVEDVVDTLVAASVSSAATTHDILEASKQTRGAFSTIGASTEEMFSLIAIMANAGIVGRDAGTSLKRFAQQLKVAENRSTKSAEAIEMLDTEIFNADGSTRDFVSIIEDLVKGAEKLNDQDKAQAFIQLFGTDAGKAADAVIGLEDSLKTFSDTLDKVQRKGVTMELLTARASDAAGAFRRLQSVAETTATSLFGPPEVGVLNESLTRLLNRLGDFLEKTRSRTLTAGLSLTTFLEGLFDNVGRALSVAKRPVGDFFGSLLGFISVAASNLPSFFIIITPLIDTFSAGLRALSQALVLLQPTIIAVSTAFSRITPGLSNMLGVVVAANLGLGLFRRTLLLLSPIVSIMFGHVTRLAQAFLVLSVIKPLRGVLAFGKSIGGFNEASILASILIGRMVTSIKALSSAIKGFTVATVFSSLTASLNVLGGAISVIITRIAIMNASILGLNTQMIVSSGLLTRLAIGVSGLSLRFAFLAKSILLVPIAAAAGGIALVEASVGALTVSLIRLRSLGLAGVLSSIGSVVSGFSLSGVIAGVGSAIGSIITLIGGLPVAVLAAVALSVSAFNELVLGIGSSFFTRIGNLIDSVKDLFYGLWEVIAGLFTGDWDRLWYGASVTAMSAWNSIVDTVLSGVGLMLEPIRLLAGIVDKVFGTDIVNSIDKGFDGLRDRTTFDIVKKSFGELSSTAEYNMGLVRDSFADTTKNVERLNSVLSGELPDSIRRVRLRTGLEADFAGFDRRVEDLYKGLEVGKDGEKRLKAEDLQELQRDVDQAFKTASDIAKIRFPEGTAGAAARTGRLQISILNKYKQDLEKAGATQKDINKIVGGLISDTKLFVNDYTLTHKEAADRLEKEAIPSAERAINAVSELNKLYLEGFRSEQILGEDGAPTGDFTQPFLNELNPGDRLSRLAGSGELFDYKNSVIENLVREGSEINKFILDNPEKVGLDFSEQLKSKTSTLGVDIQEQMQKSFSESRAEDIAKNIIQPVVEASNSSELKSATKRIGDEVKTGFNSGFNDSGDAVRRFNRMVVSEVRANNPSVLRAGIDVGSSLSLGVFQGVTKFKETFALIPSAILKHIESGVLGFSEFYNSGRRMLMSLRDGMRNYMNSELKTYLSDELVTFIQDNKGPIAYDRTILVSQGQAVMQGFKAGMEEGFKPVKSWLNSVGPSLRGYINADEVYPISVDAMLGRVDKDGISSSLEELRKKAPVEYGVGGLPAIPSLGGGLFPSVDDFIGPVSVPRPWVGFSDMISQARALSEMFGVYITSTYRSPSYNASVGGAPNSLHTHGRAVDFAGSPGSLDRLYAYLRRFFGSVLQELLWRTGGHYDHLHAGWRFGGYRERGGSVSGGTAYVVGEAGPELFIPNNSSGGSIISNKDIMSLFKMMKDQADNDGRRGGDTTINVTSNSVDPNIVAGIIERDFKNSMMGVR